MEAASTVPATGKNHIQDKKIVNLIQETWQTRMNTYTSIDTILNATDADTWSSRIIQSLIDTLSYDFSAYGMFGTPDNDIRKAVFASGNEKNVWVKLLGVKMKVLLLQLDSLEGISNLQKDRIRELDRDFKQVFPWTSTPIVPYATKI